MEELAFFQAHFMLFKLYELFVDWRFLDNSKNPFMRTSIILAFVFLGNFSLTAQTESKVYIQSRAFHKPNSKYLTQLDAGFGADVNLYNSKKLDLNLGAAVNYGTYKNKNGEETGTAFISFFKRSEVHYFDHWELSQFCVEAPVSVEWNILNFQKSEFAFVGGLSPQFLAHVRIKGNSFDETVELSGSPLLSIKHDSDFDVLQNSRFPILNDVFFKSGIQIQQKLKSNKTIVLESGAEYSSFGKSLGWYLKAGWQL